MPNIQDKARQDISALGIKQELNIRIVKKSPNTLVLTKQQLEREIQQL